MKCHNKKCSNEYKGNKCPKCGCPQDIEDALLFIVEHINGYKRGTRSIGRGGFATTFEATKLGDSSLKLCVKWFSAVKNGVDFEEKQAADQKQKTMAHEAEIMNLLNEIHCDHFPRFYHLTERLGEIVQIDPDCFNVSIKQALFMQLIEGQDLSKKYKCENQYYHADNKAEAAKKHKSVMQMPIFPFEEINNLAVQMFGALSRMHEQAKICHFDIKPDNIMISDIEKVEGNTKYYLIDFGLSTEIKNIERQAGGKKAAIWDGAGTARYMCPIPMSVYCDVYALGQTLKTVMTGLEPGWLDNNIFLDNEFFDSCSVSRWDGNDVQKWNVRRDTVYNELREKHKDSKLFAVIDRCIAQAKTQDFTARQALDLLLDRKYCPHCNSILKEIKDGGLTRCKSCRGITNAMADMDFCGYLDESNNMFLPFVINPINSTLNEISSIPLATDLRCDIIHDGKLYALTNDDIVTVFEAASLTKINECRLSSNAANSGVVYNDMLIIPLVNKHLALIDLRSMKCRQLNIDLSHMGQVPFAFSAPLMLFENSVLTAHKNAVIKIDLKTLEAKYALATEDCEICKGMAIAADLRRVFFSDTSGTLHSLPIADISCIPIDETEGHVGFEYVERGIKWRIERGLVYKSGLHFRADLFSASGERHMRYINWYDTNNPIAYRAYTTFCPSRYSMPTIADKLVYVSANNYYALDDTGSALKNCEAVFDCSRNCAVSCNAPPAIRLLNPNLPAAICFANERVNVFQIINNVPYIITAAFKDKFIARSKDRRLCVLEGSQ